MMAEDEDKFGTVNSLVADDGSLMTEFLDDEYLLRVSFEFRFEVHENFFTTGVGLCCVCFNILMTCGNTCASVLVF